ncbi:MAG: GHMP kinase [Nitrososphaera sp.]
MASALISAPVALARSFSPAHITGFFDKPAAPQQNAMYAGSVGAGFSIDKGIYTTVQVHESRVKGYSITINGRPSRDAEVSKWVAEKYMRYLGSSFFVSIDHHVEIPIGYGLGSSGAAALSLSYALNSALGTGLSQTEAAQIAHRAEIECKTGLGTVIAEFAGGFEARQTVGAPGVGLVSTRPLDGYSAVILCLSPISTKTYLSCRNGFEQGLGTRMLSELAAGGYQPEEFMKMSRAFSARLGIDSGKCKAPMEALARSGYVSSVALFGETVFALVPSEDAWKAERILQPFDGDLLVCGIDPAGARLI